MKRFLFVLGICFLIGGCAHKVEMSQLGIVAGMGIDKTSEGYRMTVQVINPSSVAGNHSNSLPVFTISAEGDSIFEAYRRLTTLTSKVLYLPHLSVIVVDEEIANDGINVIMDFALRNVQIRPNITLLVAKGIDSQNVLRVLSPGDNIPINQLDSLSNMCLVCSSRDVNYNLYDVVGMINAKGSNPVINAVSIIGDNPKEGSESNNLLETNSPIQLQIGHLGAFKSDKLVGYLDDNEAQYYNLIVGNAKRFVITTETEEGYLITFEARKSKTDIEPDIDQQRFKIKCEVNGILMEDGYPIDLTNPDNVKVLQGYLEKSLKEDLLGVIQKTQSDLQSDILGVGSKIYQRDPKKWLMVEGYWDEIYPTLTPEIEVKVTINSVGDIQNLKK